MPREIEEFRELRLLHHSEMRHIIFNRGTNTFFQKTRGTSRLKGYLYFKFSEMIFEFKSVVFL